MRPRNRKRSKAISLICAFLIFASLLPVPVLGADAKSFENTQTLAPGLSMTTQLSRFSSGSKRQAFTLDYTPGMGVKPIVAYGSKVYGKSDINYVTNYVESLGYTVMAAVNADYFNMETGLPTGMLINNGRLCTSDGAWNAVGFMADGSVICGTPGLSMRGVASDGVAFTIYALNKVRTGSGIYLYSEDFGSTTRTTAAGTEVVLQANDGDYLALGRPLTLTVVSTGHRSGTSIGKNQFVLSLTDANTANASLAFLQPGMTVTITAATADTQWHNVVYSCGGGNMLARNGQLTSEATTGSDPRTILGTRPDGSAEILVVDGRQSTVSSGISLKEGAQQLLNSGCTNVINLDGGGSTVVKARYAGQQDSQVVSSPSEGSLRKCANYIVFVNDGDKNAAESGIAVYPRTGAVLGGAALALEGRSFNADYYPVGSYGNCFYVSEGEGSVSGNTFYAPMTAGQVKIGASTGGLSSYDAVIDVVTDPESISFVRSGSTAAISSITVDPGSTTNLDMYVYDGLRRVTSQDSLFTFAVTGNIGTIDANGVFTAGSAPGLSGTITATYGSRTVSLTVNVGKAPQVLESFENKPDYTASQGGSASIPSTPDNARYGMKALKLSYTASCTFTAPKAMSVSSATYVSLMAKGSGSFYVDFATSSGTVKQPISLSGTGWQYVAVKVPAGAVSITGFSADSTSAASGSILIDQVMSHYGASAAGDVTPPVITINEYAGGTLTAVISDNYEMPVTKSMIEVDIDGAAAEFTYDSASGVLTCVLPQTAGMHRVTVTAKDYFENISRQSVNYGSTQSVTFTDMNGHWASDYVEYLRIKGVFSTDTKFNPQTPVSNEMAATIISRYLGVDTSQYANVQLPYIDAGSIQSWALPHVKAMYSMGIMIGSSNSAGQRTFSPQGAAARCQVMTILGRTISRGYSYSAAPFSDAGSIQSWAVDHINLLYAMGIVDGYGGTNEIKPNNTITRAEFASLLFKMY